MENSNKWAETIRQQITDQRNRISEKEAKKFKLDLLVRLSKRVAEFAERCPQCNDFRKQILQMVENLSALPQAPKKERRQYRKNLNVMIRHLQKAHHLIMKGQNTEKWAGIGVSLGVAIGAGVHNVGLGIAIGIALGVAIGMEKDKRAEKGGQLI